MEEKILNILKKEFKKTLPYLINILRIRIKPNQNNFI